MTRDQVLTYIKDKNSKSKLYRSENWILSKLLEVVSQYHDKDALIFIQPGEEFNQVELVEKLIKDVGVVTKSGTWLTWPRTIAALLIMFASLVEDSTILLFVAEITKNMPATQTAPLVMGEPL